jgi:protein-tyrosine phosphatase
VARLDAAKITPLLYQGSRPPQGRSLYDLGFRAVFLTAAEHQPEAEKFPGLDAVVSVRLHDDGEPPPLGELISAMETSGIAASIVRSGRKVLITCNMGFNRSGIVTALTLMRLQRSKSTDDIVSHVRACRPTALSNQYFVDFLRSIDRRSLSEPSPYQRRARTPRRTTRGRP